MNTPLPLRTRLLLNYLAILLSGMGLTALLSWQSVESLYIDTQRENLLAQANLTAAALQGQPLPAMDAPYQQTSNIQPGIHSRLLSQQGVTLYSLPIPPGEQLSPAAENNVPISPQDLQTRPEIAAAIQGQSAAQVRWVLDRRVLYAAAPVLGDDGSVLGVVYLAEPLPSGGVAGKILLNLAAAALVAILITLLASTLLSRRIVAPMEAIGRAAEMVRAGDFSASVSTASAIAELNALGQVFNRMTTSLRQADQMKSAFISDVTHELRTPLTVIKGTIETLQDGALDDVAGRGPLLNSMQRETERLIRLVSDLLVLTRADAGQLNLDIRPIDLCELARERCQQLARLAANRDVTLEVRGLASACVLADRDRLSQVLDNLLDNAIRYTAVGSLVVVEVTAGVTDVRCAVQDQGQGIAAQHLPLIFERFYRADAARARHSGGAGLGLAIVRAFILAMGGDTGAQSQLGQGASIYFSLPSGQNCHTTD